MNLNSYLFCRVMITEARTLARGDPSTACSCAQERAAAPTQHCAAAPASASNMESWRSFNPPRSVNAYLAVLLV